jgi:hypothetical protein
MEKKMSDLMPISVEYNVFVGTANEQSYSIKSKVTVSEAAYVISLINDDFDRVAEYLKSLGNT